MALVYQCLSVSQGMTEGNFPLCCVEGAQLPARLGFCSCILTDSDAVIILILSEAYFSQFCFRVYFCLV